MHIITNNLFAGLILAAGLFVFASVLNDSFSPVIYQSMDGGGDGDRFDNELQSDYDYRYGWSFVACSLAFLASEASAVFTITAYFRRLEDRVQYTAVNRKPSLDTPPLACGGDRTSSACSADGRANSPDSDAGATATPTAETTSRSDQSSSSAAAASGRHQSAQCASSGGGDQVASSSSSSPGGGTAESCSNSAATSKTPPDICPPKIGCDGSASGASGGTTGCRIPAAASSYCSATLSHPHKSQHQHHNHQQQHHHHQQHTQHYRQTLAVGGNGSCYEVDTTKPCTCTSATTLTTKRYATIAGVARHNGGKQYTTTTTTALTNNHNNNNGSGGGRRTVAGLAAIKESVASLADHHSHNSGHRKPDPPTRRLKASVGGYVVPQTPIAALEALDCPPAADPRLVVPSSV
ncbi:MOB kinase activator-like 2 [Aphis craccivora]|uniref:MOB kinase activator-like 2 n=1 Tax=Aphis craccivora TaxID=307492 RepID=A0A6G0ZFG8_APHCR|nr:MOB kinase activator-like 2 [Aphis craccivora]